MNLLPRQQKDIIYGDVLFKFFFVALIIGLFLAVTFLILLYNTIFYLNLQIAPFEERIKTERATQKINAVEGMEAEIAELNETLVKIDKIRKRGSFNLPYILRLIGGAVPEGVTLRSISFIGGKISISGHADERSGVSELEEELQKESAFENVESPLSNIVKERDINFTFSFSLR